VSALPPARRPRGTFAGRTALLTTAVAAVVVVIAVLVGYGLVRSAAESEARRALARQADVVAGTSVPGPGAGGRLGPYGQRLVPLLRRQGIEVVRVGPQGRPAGLDPVARDAVAPYSQDLAAGRRVSAVETTPGGETVLLEGRPLDEGGAVVLVQRRDESRALARRLVGRAVLALLAGLAVAALAGFLLARRLTRPLRQAAAAAHELAGGRRDVRLAVEGPGELAELAVALNTLASALQVSEGRQREFLLSVSHELRTPLTAVKGFAESLADGVTTGEDVPRVGATVLAEATRLERLVNDLLDLARLGAQSFRVDLAPVDLTELVSGAAAVWRARCEAVGVRFAAQLPDGPVVVGTDATRVRQIVDGLAENALRVTPAGRPIVLALRPEPQGVALEVRDGGPGLAPGDLAVAFQRGVLHDRYRGVRQVGTGVGLALVHGLATRLGGTAEAGRAPEGGASFVVRLPWSAPPDLTRVTVPLLAQVAAAPPSPAAAVPSQGPGGGRSEPG